MKLSKLNLPIKAYVLATIAAVSVAAGSGAVSAATFNIVAAPDEDTTQEVSGTLIINLAGDQTSAGTNEYIYDVTVTHNSGDWDNATLTAFYLASTPNSTYKAGSSTSTVFEFAQANQLFPGTGTVFDFCFDGIDSNDNCVGGNAGLSEQTAPNNSETFEITVSSATTGVAPQFFEAGLRWQTIGDGDETEYSAKGIGGCDPCDPPVDVNVPEVTATGSLAALGSAFALMSLMMERRRRRYSV